MNTDNRPNARFTKILVIEAFFWTIGGIFLCLLMAWPIIPFLLVMSGAIIGLGILMILVKLLLNSRLPLLMRVLQFFFFSVFKLVCLGFLAITLKRFHELSTVSILIGVSFYWIAPLLAGAISARESQTQ